MNATISDSIKSAAKSIIGLERDGQCGFIPLKGDASYRSYFRIAPERSGKTFVLMIMHRGFNSPAEEITKTSKKIDELPFINVQKFLKQAGVQVPEIIGFDRNESIIVLEDLGDSSLYSSFKNLDSKKRDGIYRDLIKEMVTFQTTTRPSSPCVAFYRSYDMEMCKWELDHFREYALEGFLNLKLDPCEAKVIGEFYEKISNQFMSQCFCFCHRDYHSKNIMLKDDGFKIIDFQDALLAPPQYDLASLLRDSYIHLEPGTIQELVDFYIGEFGAKTGKAIDKTQFTKSFDFVSIQRNLKAAGRFAFIEKKKANASYLQYVPETLSKIGSNMAKYYEFKEAHKILKPYFDKICNKILRDYRG